MAKDEQPEPSFGDEVGSEPKPEEPGSLGTPDPDSPTEIAPSPPAGQKDDFESAFDPLMYLDAAPTDPGAEASDALTGSGRHEEVEPHDESTPSEPAHGGDASFLSDLDLDETGVLGEPDAGGTGVLGEPDEGGIGVLGEPDEGGIGVLGEPDEGGIGVLGEPDEGGIGVLGEPKRGEVFALAPTGYLDQPEDEPPPPLVVPPKSPIKVKPAPVTPKPWTSRAALVAAVLAAAAIPSAAIFVTQQNQLKQSREAEQEARRRVSELQKSAAQVKAEPERPTGSAPEVADRPVAKAAPHPVEPEPIDKALALTREPATAAEGMKMIVQLAVQNEDHDVVVQYVERLADSLKQREHVDALLKACDDSLNVTTDRKERSRYLEIQSMLRRARRAVTADASPAAGKQGRLMRRRADSAGREVLLTTRNNAQVLLTVYQPPQAAPPADKDQANREEIESAKKSIDADEDNFSAYVTAGKAMLDLAHIRLSRGEFDNARDGYKEAEQTFRKGYDRIRAAPSQDRNEKIILRLRLGLAEAMGDLSSLDVRTQEKELVAFRAKVKELEDKLAAQPPPPSPSEKDKALVTLRAKVKELEDKLAAQPPPPSPSEKDKALVTLRAKVKELEGKLAAQPPPPSPSEKDKALVTLHAKVKELEGKLAAQPPPPSPSEKDKALVTLRAKVKELEDKLAAQPPPTPPNSVVKDLKAQIADLEGQIGKSKRQITDLKNQIAQRDATIAQAGRDLKQSKAELFQTRTALTQGQAAAKRSEAAASHLASFVIKLAGNELYPLTAPRELTARVTATPSSDPWLAGLADQIAAKGTASKILPTVPLPRAMLAFGAYADGLQRLQQKDYRGAEVKFSQAIAIDPEDARYHYLRGVARYLVVGGPPSAVPRDAAIDAQNGVMLERVSQPTAKEIGRDLVRVQGDVRNWLESYRQPGRALLSAVPPRQPVGNMIAGFSRTPQ